MDTSRPVITPCSASPPQPLHLHCLTLLLHASRSCARNTRKTTPALSLSRSFCVPFAASQVSHAALKVGVIPEALGGVLSSVVVLRERGLASVFRSQDHTSHAPHSRGDATLFLSPASSTDMMRLENEAFTTLLIPANSWSPSADNCHQAATSAPQPTPASGCSTQIVCCPECLKRWCTVLIQCARWNDSTPTTVAPTKDEVAAAERQS
eukprot:3444867-Rhodomonas_salina.1